MGINTENAEGGGTEYTEKWDWTGRLLRVGTNSRLMICYFKCFVKSTLSTSRIAYGASFEQDLRKMKKTQG